MKTNGNGHRPGERGRRFKLNPDGDVFLFRARPEDGSWEPLTRVDDEGNAHLLQFHNVEDASSYVKKSSLPELGGQTIIVAEVRRQFKVEVESTVKVRVQERGRVLAERKSERKIPVVVNREREQDETQATE